LIAILAGLAVTAFITANAAGMYHPRVGRFLQRDPGPVAASLRRVGTAGSAVAGVFLSRTEWLDGMNLYQSLRGNPVAARDPFGTITLGTRIGVILDVRIAVIIGGRGHQALTTRNYELADGENEMPKGAVGMKMDEFYHRYLQQQYLPEGRWQDVDIPFQSAQALVGVFVMPGLRLCDTGWWLSSSHDVKVHGHARVCKAGNRFYVKDLNAAWQWHDEIDANSYATLAENNENAVVTVIEGTWDILVDKLLQADFYVIIHFTDDIAKTTLPPGPPR